MIDRRSIQVAGISAAMRRLATIIGLRGPDERQRNPGGGRMTAGAAPDGRRATGVV